MAWHCFKSMNYLLFRFFITQAFFILVTFIIWLQQKQCFLNFLRNENILFCHNTLFFRLSFGYVWTYGKNEWCYQGNFTEWNINFFKQISKKFHLMKFKKKYELLASEGFWYWSVKKLFGRRSEISGYSKSKLEK